LFAIPSFVEAIVGHLAGDDARVSIVEARLRTIAAAGA
jgi:hypothetical protein